MVQPGRRAWDPEESILVQRMASTDPDVKMPELPSLEVDQEGVKLISDWIAAMPEVDYSAILPGRDGDTHGPLFSPTTATDLKAMVV